MLCLPHEMIPPMPHSKKYLLEPNSQESCAAPLAPLLVAQEARENGPLNGLWRADSINEENILT